MLKQLDICLERVFKAYSNDPSKPSMGSANPTPYHLSFPELLMLSDEELAQYDIAEINLACASGLPGTERIDIPADLRTLDQWAAQVYYKTQRCSWFLQNPEKYDHSFNLFCIHVMISVLQRDFGVHYNPECMADDAVLHPEDVFIHGILQGFGGTCASLPVLYAAVGRRLNYPLKLVKAPCHCFVRWDDPNGERFNIEASNQGFNCHSDDYYRTGRYPITPDQEREGCFLISQSPRQELAEFLAQKGFCWLDLENYREAAESFILASILHPEQKLSGSCAVSTLEKWHKHLRSHLPPNFPNLRVEMPPRRFPDIPQFVEEQMIGLEVMQEVLQNPAYQSWWESLRQSPNQRPLDVPAGITVKLNE